MSKYIEPESNTFRSLEVLVDANGLEAVLTALEEICEAKADHLASNWQDYKAAKQWLKVGVAISKTLTIASTVS